MYSATSIPVILVAVMVSAFGTFAFVPAAGSHRAELFPTTLRSSANTAAANLALGGSALGLIICLYTSNTLGHTHTIIILGLGVLIAGGLTLLLPAKEGQDWTAISVDRP